MKIEEIPIKEDDVVNGRSTCPDSHCQAVAAGVYYTTIGGSGTLFVCFHCLEIWVIPERR